MCVSVLSTGGTSVGFGYFDKYSMIYVDHLHYNGPTHFSSETSYNCEYGGIYIISETQNKNRKLISICDERSDYTVYGNQLTILVVVIWYAGYSSGALVGNIKTTPCFIQYRELTDKDNSEFLKPEVINDFAPCQGYICSPRRNNLDINCIFHIEASNRSIGPALISVSKSNSLNKCRHIPDFQMPEPVSNITATLSDRWPLGEFRNMAISHNVSVIWMNRFFYLHGGRVRLPHICDENSPTTQMLVVVQVSTCRAENGLFIVKPVANIHSLSSDALVTNTHFDY